MKRTAFESLLAVLLLALAPSSCGRSTAPTEREAARLASVPSAHGPASARIVAVGDLHGDLQATRKVLRLAAVLDERDAWSGGTTIVVQTGDQLDRGDDEPDILALLARLQGEARAAGGDVLVLNGNHELMNVAGDFRYVTADGFADYARADVAQGVTHSDSEATPRRGRAQAYAPGGPVARELARRPITLVVGDTLFVHGGVLSSHVDYGLAKIDREVSEWMMGTRAAPPAIVLASDSPVWTRVYSDGEPSPAACAQLASVLQRVGVRRLVVGHTVQPTGINAACGGKVWRIDVGLTHYYGGPTQALEIRGDSLRVLAH